MKKKTGCGAILAITEHCGKQTPGEGWCWYDQKNNNFGTVSFVTKKALFESPKLCRGAKGVKITYIAVKEGYRIIGYTCIMSSEIYYR
jgi:hypothetical protein